jgi:hypothetical protein
VKGNTTTGSTRDRRRQGSFNETGNAELKMQVQITQGKVLPLELSAVTANIEHVIKTEFVKDTAEVSIEGHCDYDNNTEGQNYGEINILNQPEVIVNPTSEQQKHVFQKYTSVKTVDGKKVRECQICGKTIRDQRTLLRHLENCHVKGIFRYLCPHCPKELSTASKLWDHERSAHTQKSVKDSQQSFQP